MKRYFIALFILPLLLVACDDDKLEMMPPYIFFNYDVDTYVMDIDNPNLPDSSFGHLATYVYNRRKTSRNPPLCSISSSKIRNVP